jgi:hypothetical protein
MKSDPNVYLFYKSKGIRRWVCAVARRLNGDGFLVTTYPTDAIKEGEHLSHHPPLQKVAQKITLYSIR